MTHPEADRLIDLVKDRTSDPEALAHLDSCESCRSQYELLEEFARVLRPGPPTPKPVVDRVMALIPSSSPPKRMTFGNLIWSGSLGAVTAILALLFAGSVGAGGPEGIIVLGLVAGLASVWAQKRALGHARQIDDALST